MKEFMTGAAMMILLCVFLTQFTVNQVIHNKIILAESDINIFIEEVKQEGCVRSGIGSPASDLKAALQRDLKLESDDEIIITSSTTSPVLRGEIIDYKIKYPLKGVIGASGFFNLENNDVSRVREGSAASEYVDADLIYGE